MKAAKDSVRVPVGVVGVGSLGQWHTRIYSEIPGAELVGVYDTNATRAAEIAARYHTRAFPSIAALAGAVRAASVVVPPAQHAAATLELMAQGVHVLVEKPIAASLTDAESMIREARARQVILQVGHVERFNPVLDYLKGILTQPRYIEAIRLANYPPARPGLPPRGTEVSVVYDMMIHDLEIILHIVPSPVVDIQAVGVPVLSASEDLANVRLKFGNGCVANITASRISFERTRKIRVFQPDTYVSLDYGEQTGKLYRIAGKTIT
ncbi:MAG: Gfo/Idh/MocA family oxidoreductase, partial [bacterium]